MFKRVLPHLFSLLLVFSFPQTVWTAEAPVGFGGIQWGAPLSELTGMAVADDTGQVKYYRRHSDLLSLGDAALKRISYGFYKGRFYSVLIEFEGRNNFEKIKAHLLATYGNAARVGSQETNYTWSTADGASVNLKYSENARQGYVFYVNRIIAEQP